MATLVKEIMNPDVYRVGPKTDVESVIRAIRAMKITAAPVVDKGTLIGLVSLRDMVRPRQGPLVKDCMTETALTLNADKSIEEAAAFLAQHNLHHAAVTDENSNLVGFLSALDVIRGLTGLPRQHPVAFHHYDPDTSLAWTHDFALSTTSVTKAPNQAGVVLVIAGGAGVREQPIEAVGSDDIAAAVSQLVDNHQSDERDLRFRFALSSSADEREAALVVLNKLIADAN